MKKDYMARLTRWARWLLPRQEAEDVLADYRDIVGTLPRTDEELRRDLGKPRDVVKPLVQPKQYRVWLAVFALMAACILIPAASLLPGGPYFVFFNLFYTDIPGFDFCRLFLIGGAALSLVWFRPRKGESKAPLPRPIPIILIVELVLMGAVWWVSWQITLYPNGALANPIFYLPLEFWWPLGNILVGGNSLSFVLEWSAIPLAVVGMVGLVKARIRDRRWRAVYVMSLSLMMLALFVLSMLTSMDFATPFRFPLWHSVEIALIGLVGTGAALC